MAIVALLEMNRTGQPTPIELRQTAQEAAQELLTMAGCMAAANAQVGEAQKH